MSAVSPSQALASQVCVSPLREDAFATMLSLIQLPRTAAVRTCEYGGAGGTSREIQPATARHRDRRLWPVRARCQSTSKCNCQRRGPAKLADHDGKRCRRPQIYVRADCTRSPFTDGASLLSSVRLSLCGEAQLRCDPFEISGLAYREAALNPTNPQDR